MDMIRILLLLLIFSFGCQTGRIPCPKFKGAKSGHHKRYRNLSASLTTRATVKEAEPEFRVRKTPDARYVQNVSMEEWDCPQPGAKKYLPRNVKDNIRRNARKVNEDVSRVSADSTSAD